MGGFTTTFEMKRPKLTPITPKCRGRVRGDLIRGSGRSASDPDFRGTGPPGAGVTSSEPASAPGEPAKRASSAAIGLDSLWKGRRQRRRPSRGPGARARAAATPTPHLTGPGSRRAPATAALYLSGWRPCSGPPAATPRGLVASPSALPGAGPAPRGRGSARCSRRAGRRSGAAAAEAAGDSRAPGV